VDADRDACYKQDTESCDAGCKALQPDVQRDGTRSSRELGVLSVNTLVVEYCHSGVLHTAGELLGQRDIARKSGNWADYTQAVWRAKFSGKPWLLATLHTSVFKILSRPSVDIPDRLIFSIDLLNKK
jgi:hypothetical protein